MKNKSNKTVAENSQTAKRRGKPSNGSGVLFEIRDMLGLSQVDMANRIGYTNNNTISHIERNGKTPTDREQKFMLLKTAEELPQEKLSSKSRKWIEHTRKEFEKKPLAGLYS